MSKLVDAARPNFFRYSLIAIFLLALGARLGYLSAVDHGPLGIPDSPAYQALAEAIKERRPYETHFEGGPGGFPADLQRPPGYPFFVYLANLQAGTGVSRVQTALVQSVCGAFFTILFAIMVSRLCTELVGLLAGLFYAADWVTVLHTPLLLAETIFTMALTLSIIVYAFYLKQQRSRQALLAGLLLGAAALIKPLALVVIIPFLLAWFCRSKRRWVGLVFLVSTAAVVAPWMARNYQRHGLFTLSAINTTLLYFYTAQGAVDNYTWQELGEKIDELNIYWSAQPFFPPERERRMREDSVKLIREHWPMALKHALTGIVRTCGGTGRDTMLLSLAGADRISPLWSTTLPMIQIILLWVLGAIGAVAAYQKSSLPFPTLVLFITSIALVILSAANLVGYSRYRLPVTPLICVLSAIGSARVIAYLKTKAEGVGSLGGRANGGVV